MTENTTEFGINNRVDGKERGSSYRLDAWYLALDGLAAYGAYQGASIAVTEAAALAGAGTVAAGYMATGLVIIAASGVVAVVIFGTIYGVGLLTLSVENTRNARDSIGEAGFYLSLGSRTLPSLSKALLIKFADLTMASESDEEVRNRFEVLSKDLESEFSLKKPKLGDSFFNQSSNINLFDSKKLDVDPNISVSPRIRIKSPTSIENEGGFELKIETGLGSESGDYSDGTEYVSYV